MTHRHIVDRSAHRVRWPALLVGICIGVIVAVMAPAAVAQVPSAPSVRQVTAATDTIIPIQTRIRFTTMVVLPADEEILDVVCGDKDFWVISSTHNIAHIKPAKEGAATNLNLVTASGAVFSFLLNEKGSGPPPDLKIYVTTEAETTPSTPKYYTAAQFDLAQAELQEAKSALDAERRRAADAIAAYRHAYPGQLHFAYGPVKYEKPFFVSAIWHDGRFTYLKTDAAELPAIYEVKDGAPAIVNFDVRDGVYVVPKVLDRGYLALGKAQFPFSQQGR